jgi:hypothetical protein
VSVFSPGHSEDRGVLCLAIGSCADPSDRVWCVFWALAQPVFSPWTARLRQGTRVNWVVGQLNAGDCGLSIGG